MTNSVVKCDATDCTIYSQGSVTFHRGDEEFTYCGLHYDAVVFLVRLDEEGRIIPHMQRDIFNLWVARMGTIVSDVDAENGEGF